MQILMNELKLQVSYANRLGVEHRRQMHVAKKTQEGMFKKLRDKCTRRDTATDACRHIDLQPVSKRFPLLYSCLLKNCPLVREEPDNATLCSKS